MVAINGVIQTLVNLVWSDFKHLKCRLLVAIGCEGGCWRHRGAVLAERLPNPKHVPVDNVPLGSNCLRVLRAMLANLVASGFKHSSRPDVTALKSV